jgi:hypothetical protein
MCCGKERTEMKIDAEERKPCGNRLAFDPQHIVKLKLGTNGRCPLENETRVRQKKIEEDETRSLVQATIVLEGNEIDTRTDE